MPDDFGLDELRETFDSSNGEGLDAGLPDWARFLSGVTKSLIARRAVLGESDDDGPAPAIFFLGDFVDCLGPRPAPTSTFGQGLVNTHGSAWFLNMEARFGYGVAHSLDEEGLLALARTTAELQSLPTLLYMPRAAASQIMFFERGLANEASHRSEYDLEMAGPVTNDECNAAIDRLHEQALRTPGGPYSSSKLWQEASQHKPIEHAEREIQARVRAAIIGAFPDVHATEEVLTDTGRYDIALVRVRGPVRTYLGLLELKVLRHGENPSTTIQDGIRQAEEYGNSLATPWNELACFDMRPQVAGDEPLDAHRADASARGVELRRWPLFPSPAKYREYLASLPETA